MIQPAHHLFKLIAGATFNFRFQYLVADQPSVTPVDLSAYSALWTITSLNQAITYMEYPSGGIIGTSGVFFGGDLHDAKTGIIDLVITDFDTASLPWTAAAYILTVMPPTLITIPLLLGSLNVVGTLPS